MHARLRSKQTVGVFTGDRKGGRLESGLLARLVVEQSELEAVALGPAPVHAEEHLGPVLRLRSSRSRVQGDNRVQSVVFSRQQRCGFELVDLVPKRIQSRAQVARDVLAFASQLEVSVEVGEGSVKAYVGFEPFFEPAARGKNFRRSILILPEVGLGYLLLDGLELAASCGCVKENS